MNALHIFLYTAHYTFHCERCCPVQHSEVCCPVYHSERCCSLSLSPSPSLYFSGTVVNVPTHISSSHSSTVLSTVHCILCSGQCALYTVHYTLKTCQCTLHTVNFTIYTYFPLHPLITSHIKPGGSQGSRGSSQCTVYIVHCTLFDVHCKLYTAHWKLDTVNYLLSVDTANVNFDPPSI